MANITVNSRAQQLITNATENITLNIDRCRNYAQTLSGYNFTAGIFGDRYAYGRTQPATDTYIQNCFSVTPGQKDREISLYAQRRLGYAERGKDRKQLLL